MDSRQGWSSSFRLGELKVAFLFTMLDLCSPSNGETSRMVKQKIGELAGQGFCIVYVYMGLMEPSEDHIFQTLAHLTVGTRAVVHAWIAPHVKWKQWLGYSASTLLSPKNHPFFNHQLVNGIHTFICSESAFIGEEGEKKVEDLHLIFPGYDGEKRAVTNLGDDFTTLFSHLSEALK
ncbi:hypothetical protein KI387_034507, partial [Taxus chinensis]